ncbi:hypothetical protein [Streptomyces sp. A1136]|uniref:hypothetical protein n=1 Tax=Streptomyces sp. A1136 TaxID=2563102 RepID=UPI0019D09F24|nr:hypothetical protein [Streptomyces sp. A1136]
MLTELGLADGLAGVHAGIPREAARWELVRWLLRLIVNGSLAPGAGGDVIRYEGWGALARPQALRPLVDKVEAYNAREAVCGGTREQMAGAIVAEARRLLADPWPPLDRSGTSPAGHIVEQAVNSPAPS